MILMLCLIACGYLAPAAKMSTVRTLISFAAELRMSRIPSVMENWKKMAIPPALQMTKAVCKLECGLKASSIWNEEVRASLYYILGKQGDSLLILIGLMQTIRSLVGLYVNIAFIVYIFHCVCI